MPLTAPRDRNAPQNWVVEGTSVRPKTPVLAKPSSNGLPAGFSGGEQGYTRAVQDNELASTHMEQLGKADNRVLQQARQRGVQQGASRGGINSNLAAAGGEAAWLDAAGNVAMQQAGAFGTAAGQNLDSLRQQRMSAEGNAAQLGAANIGAQASMYNSDNDLLSSRENRLQDRDLTLSGRDWTAGQSDLDRGVTREGWDRQAQESQRDRDYTTGRDERQQGYTRENMDRTYDYGQDAANNDLDRQIAAETYRDMLDNPEEWDEYTATGAVDFFSRYLNPGRQRPPQTQQPVPTNPV